MGSNLNIYNQRERSLKMVIKVSRNRISVDTVRCLFSKDTSMKMRTQNSHIIKSCLKSA